MTSTAAVNIGSSPASTLEHRPFFADKHFVPATWDTLIYVPSISLGPLTRRHLIELEYFQERNYYLAAALRDEKFEIIFVVSRAIHDDLLIAHFDLMCRANILPRSAMARLRVIKVEQPPEISLSAALLADIDAIRQLESLLTGRRGGFDFWTVGEDEIALSRALDRPYLGMPAEHCGADTKVAAKKIFDNAGVIAPPDFGVFYKFDDIWGAMQAGTFAGVTTLLLKLNSEEGGNGIARLALDSNPASPEALRKAVIIDKSYIPFDEFEEQMRAQGALLEVFLADEVLASPSAKMFIDDSGEVHVLATHDQVLQNSMYLGCRFPADQAYRSAVMEAGLAIDGPWL